MKVFPSNLQSLKGKGIKQSGRLCPASSLPSHPFATMRSKGREPQVPDFPCKRAASSSTPTPSHPVSPSPPGDCGGHERGRCAGIHWGNTAPALLPRSLPPAQPAHELGEPSRPARPAPNQPWLRRRHGQHPAAQRSEDAPRPAGSWGSPRPVRAPPHSPGAGRKRSAQLPGAPAPRPRRPSCAAL